MRRLLLDTHVLLWWLKNDKRLKKAVKEEIANPENEVFVSAVSTWEISIKTGLGKLKAPKNIDQIIIKKGFLPLDITLSHGQHAGRLPQHHRDPFDRMLIAQAQLEGLIIVTHDDYFTDYGVPILWE